jgi:hypothetical protein
VDSLEPLGRVLLVVGIVLVVAGLLLVLGVRIPFLGRLPGDLRIERDGLVVVIPLATMFIVSVILTILLNVVGRGR